MKKIKLFQFINLKYKRMIKSFILVIAVFEAIILFKANTRNSPELSLLENKHFVETKFMNPQDTIVHNFKFQNIGTQKLEIYSVETSCTCTVPTYTKTVDSEQFGIITLKTTAGQLKNTKEVHAVIKSNSNNRFSKVSLISK